MALHDSEIREKHVSYGMVSFSRRTGDPGRLFGSALKSHGAYVTLAIKRAELIHDGGHDYFYGNTRGDIVEVDMSAAQFAELLTTMNVGLGTPCTIRWLDGKRVESPPESPLEVEKIRSQFKREVREHVASMEKEMDGLKDLLEKKNLGQADRKTILSKFESMLRKYRDSAPFMLDQFEEATEKVVQHAKAEVDAFVTHNVIAEGLRSIAERAAGKVDEPKTIDVKPVAELAEKSGE